jgi:hypothetical protein
VATINVPEVDLAEGEVIIRDYGVHEGTLKSLVDAGVVEATGRMIETGFVQAPVARVVTP